MTSPTAFRYSDFYFMKDGRPSKWRRILTDDLAPAVQAASGFNCFCSVQTFAAPAPPEGAEPELHYAPPYADFDSADLSASQADMRKLVDFATHDLDLDRDAIRVWFSGSKGFHVVFSPAAFGVEPSTDLTYVYKALFGHLAQLLDMPTLDMSVYSKRRMWRVPNTVHAKTNLYKRELDDDEVTLGIADIMDLARQPRRETVAPDEKFYGHPTAALASKFLARFAAEYAAAQDAEHSGHVTLHPDAAEGDPVCVTDIMTNGLKVQGSRNKATLALGGYFKDTGKSEADAKAAVTGWALGLPAGFRDPDDRHVRANTASVLHTVYGSDNYHFSCKFIRSLSGPKDKPGSRVACAGDACPFIKAPETEREVTEVHLSKIGDPALLDSTVRTRLRVAGRQESPYLVPARVTYYAIDPDQDCGRGGCILHNAGGRVARDFTKGDTRTLLALCGVNDRALDMALRAVIGKFSCKGFYYEVEDMIGVTELTAVPKAESWVYDPDAERVVDEFGGDFVYQRVYAVDLDIAVNAYYEVVGRVYPHPRNQETTLVVTEAQPTQDAIEDFDLEAALPLFEPYEGDTDEVLGHLVADVAVNVTKVAGRELPLLALLMTMHSPLELRFDGERYGGWMQTLMIGDTGEAKSQLVERLVRYAGLGELLSAQSSGRTGLLYTIVQRDAAHSFLQWGAFVLNDRRLLVIDEASGLDKVDYAQLRNARRDGVFKVSRSVSGEAQTRTRLVMLSNPKWGKNLSYYTNGIEAIEQLFEHADIRRFDLVVGFRSGQVSRDLIEAQLAEPVEPIFTAESVRANMLWAWSRQPTDIYWAPGAVEAVKRVARKLNAKYEGSDIHLLSQDANEKIARMAQALAATLHSTDEKHQMIHVLPEHVDIVAELVDTVYAAPDLDFEMYVQQNNDGNHKIDYHTMLSTLIRQVQTPYDVPVADVIEMFARSKTLNNFALEALVGDPKQAKLMARALFRLGLVEAGRNGFEPTPKFRELIRQYNRHKDDPDLRNELLAAG